MEVLQPMESPNNPSSARVLIVDESQDSRDVIRTMLERRGVRILEAPEATSGLAILRQQHPEVVVLDLESCTADPSAWPTAFGAEVESNNAALVVLGNLRAEDAVGSYVVHKPYHYGPLIRKIEQLVDDSLSAGR
jgi:DNA-binding NtrC family response regulator